MKPQQRNFVIEYKSPRRQFKQERSIWGNTNFKALAKAVEIDAPQLFETKAVLDGSEQRLDAHNHTSPVTDVVNAETAPTTAAISDLVEERVEQEFVLTPVSTKPVEPAASSSKHPERKRAARRQPKAPDLTGVREILPTVPALLPAKQEELDDLVVLEAENSRLKARLVKQLQEQNEWLRAMLERFVIARKA
ncbi:hypothetical protein LAV84_23705 [Rhizobium sp. VS19-DR104.2]|uniref:hypothetical protein n=1 Tax=unclassified Rhizobium TaxID=2613769 RepID=UPI001CC74BE3|nr:MULTISPECIES: hypothetical protein [unclassified Rhizobium]MBZ5762266.1 hypothetical protein [Rhizobium sp. VS19-DR96]MBZ5768282.1 hypothetical protein [Rhizobium sp. VS19-DR129.2]MBZ5775846.1 hypothetical protein [Rhizobium sp. VS19-DRK62.2]MBZ5787133.1 hypothetical protein [Rhizobium sp. VS19-DR121]MBZ5804208.1 hypothetical protein [Rhizobium sp. VS19-DR181]